MTDERKEAERQRARDLLAYCCHASSSSVERSACLFSRVRRMEDVSVMLDRDGVGVTRNVVYRELLRSELRGDGVERGERVEEESVGQDRWRAEQSVHRDELKAHDEDDIVPPELEHKNDEDDDDDDMPSLIPAPPSLHPYVQSVRGDPPAAATGAAIARRPLSDVTNAARPPVSARKRARVYSGPSRKRGGAGSAAAATGKANNRRIQ
jgi:hypothetical protein